MLASRVRAQPFSHLLYTHAAEMVIIPPRTSPTPGAATAPTMPTPV